MKTHDDKILSSIDMEGNNIIQNGTLNSVTDSLVANHQTNRPTSSFLGTTDIEIDLSVVKSEPNVTPPEDEVCIKVENGDGEKQNEGSKDNGNFALSHTEIDQDEDTIIYEIKHEEEDKEIQAEIESYLGLTTSNGTENGKSSKEFTFASLRDIVSTFSEKKPAKKWKRGKRRKERERFNDVKCSQCSYQTVTRADLAKHAKYVHGQAVFSCPKEGCNFTTKFPGNIKHHLNSHSDERPHICGVCNAAFKRKNHLKAHMNTHSKEKPFQCPECSFKAKRKWEVTAHISAKHSQERKYQCEICGARIKMRSDLIKHMKRHSKEKKFKCCDCDKSFTVASGLKKHRQLLHEECELIPCTFKGCTSKFKLKSGLKKHVLTVHEGVRDFMCTVCNRKFSSQANLENHLVTHSAKRPHTCPFCPYRGKEEDHVLSHIGSMHGQVRIFPCKICHCKFKTNNRLKQHYQTEKHKRNLRFSLPPSDKEIKVERTDPPEKGQEEPQLPKIVSVCSVIKTEPNVQIKSEPTEYDE